VRELFVGVAACVSVLVPWCQGLLVPFVCVCVCVCVCVYVCACGVFVPW